MVENRQAWEDLSEASERLGAGSTPLQQLAIHRLSVTVRAVDAASRMRERMWVRIYP